MEELVFIPYGKRYKYAGMAPLDRAIWERFIEQNPAAFFEVAYNVAVGAGTALDTVVNKETGGDINRLYQRKIDVVAKAKDGLVIIEIKPRATTSAVGQVKGYKRLFERDFMLTENIGTLILTDELMPDVEFVAKEEGVTILVA